jgi:glycosyltransferase involved in cell wall biosynthesis
MRLRTEVATACEAIPRLLQEIQPDAIWSRSIAMSAGIRKSGYMGPLLHVYATNARMQCQGIYLNTRGLPWKRRLLLMGLWPFEYFPSKMLEREVARLCVSVTFSQNMRAQLLADLPPASSICHVIPPGVDLNVFSAENGARYFNVIERDYSLHPGDPIVLYVGRLSFAKNLTLLMDAVAQIDTPLKLVLVGSGRDEALLREYGRKINITDRLIFAGPHSEMLPGFYSISRLSVLPTTVESFGQVYLESLACGTPVVGFAGDGRRILTATSEIIDDMLTGIVIQKTTAQMLANGIRTLLAMDREQYAAMGTNARETASKQYSWKRFVEQMVTLTTSIPSGTRSTNNQEGKA